MATDLKGRVVLVTGATGGLGKTVVEEFLKTGAAVVGVARKWKQDELPAGEFMGIAGDLSSADGCHKVVQAVQSAHGRLDVLVHLMGGFAGGKVVQETPDEEWDQMMALNAKPAFLLFREAVPILLEQRAGRVIAVGSRMGLEPVAGFSAYAASKAALHALVRTLAAELKHAGATANAVVPSTIDTEANRRAMPNADPSKWVSPQALADLLIFLASEASQEVNGALIPIYGKS